MKVLLDTNILTRSAEPTHPMHAMARDAVRKLRADDAELVIVPQVVYEFWVVATRPLDRNGLGFDITTTQSEVQNIESLFPLLDDVPGIYESWKQLVALHQAKGKPAHDARLVAAMNVHGVDELLTFNKSDFIRYSAITVRSPAEVLGVTT